MGVWLRVFLKGLRMLVQLLFASSGGGGDVIPVLPGGTVDSTGSSPKFAIVSVLRNGTITSFGEDLSFATQYWHTSGQASIGDGFWVRFTRVTGTASNYTGSTVGTWHQLSSTRTFGYDVPEGAGPHTGTYTIQIASDSGGTTIVSASSSGAYSVTADSTG